MKKILSALISIILIVTTISNFVFANEGIPVYLDGTRIVFDVHPVVTNGRTLVPMRALFEALGAEVTWLDDSNTAVGKKSGITIEIQINNPTIKINTIPQEIDVPAQLINSRTMIPLRVVSETFNTVVEYIENPETIYLTSNNTLGTIYDWNENYAYYGEIENNDANGYGTLISKSDGTIGNTGIYKDGILIQGSIYYSDGGISSGTYVNNRLNGQGYEYYPLNDGYVLIEGEYTDNQLNGIGYEYHSNGDGSITTLFEGTFQNGVIISGKRIGKTQNGTSTYEGTFDENKQPHGEGVKEFVLDNGEWVISNGIFENGIFTEGTQTFHSGLIYEGIFDENGMLVYGKMTDSDNTISEGTFENGYLIEGTHKYSSQYGETVLEGKFKNDVLTEGSKSFYTEEGLYIYSGKYNANGILIDGIIIYPDNSFYSGTFDENGTWDGDGHFYYSYYNVSYAGSFIAGKKHGIFSIIDHENGTQHNAYYENDKLINSDYSYTPTPAANATSSSKQCTYANCDKKVYDGRNYCLSHNCRENGCLFPRINLYDGYCAVHSGENADTTLTNIYGPTTSNNTQKGYCLYPNCDRKVYDRRNYCRSHKCLDVGCLLPRINLYIPYCEIHNN